MTFDISVAWFLTKVGHCQRMDEIKTPKVFLCEPLGGQTHKNGSKFLTDLIKSNN
jgi:hypothetical protein